MQGSAIKPKSTFMIQNHEKDRTILLQSVKNHAGFYSNKKKLKMVLQSLNKVFSDDGKQIYDNFFISEIYSESQKHGVKMTLGGFHVELLLRAGIFLSTSLSHFPLKTTNDGQPMSPRSRLFHGSMVRKFLYFEFASLSEKL